MRSIPSCCTTSSRRMQKRAAKYTPLTVSLKTSISFIEHPIAESYTSCQSSTSKSRHPKAPFYTTLENFIPFLRYDKEEKRTLVACIKKTSLAQVLIICWVGHNTNLLSITGFNVIAASHSSDRWGFWSLCTVFCQCHHYRHATTYQGDSIPLQYLACRSKKQMDTWCFQILVSTSFSYHPAALQSCLPRQNLTWP